MRSNKFAIFLAGMLAFSTLSADEIKLGYSGLSMDYVEKDDSGNFLDSEKSGLFNIWGVDASYSLDFNDLIKGDSTNLLFMLSYVKGKSDYDGSLQNLGTGTTIPYKSKTDNFLVDAKFRAQEVRHTTELDAKIFASLGYRFWHRDLDSGGNYGYLEEYKWLYGDVGIGGDFFEGNSVLGFSGAFQYAFNPTMRANLGSGYNFNLGQTWGANAEVHFRQNLSKSFFVEVGYEYDFWNIGKSDMVANMYEPKSTTNNQYVKLSVGIKF